MKTDFIKNFMQIDEEGFAILGELRVTDERIGHKIVSNLKFNDDNALITQIDDENIIVEAFDEPIVTQQVFYQDGNWTIQGPYQTFFIFDITTLTLDEWDRFHGLTTQGLPFVFSRKAQAQFFNLLEGYTDDSITILGQTIKVPPLLPENPLVNGEDWWTKIYKDEKNPGWNLNAPAEALQTMLPKLKLPKSRILVLGCGEGHDAAFFAKDGHHVTAVDISPESIRRGKEKYGQINTLHFVEKDIFEIGSDFHQSFDLVFEHTCYCAINPSRRQQLIKIWNQCLVEKGFLLGIFFTMEKKVGPPYGASEWEIRERLKASHQFLFWGRWRTSIPRRQGKELFVYSHKKM